MSCIDSAEIDRNAEGGIDGDKCSVFARSIAMAGCKVLEYRDLRSL